MINSQNCFVQNQHLNVLRECVVAKKTVIDNYLHTPTLCHGRSSYGCPDFLRRNRLDVAVRPHLGHAHHDAHRGISRLVALRIQQNCHTSMLRV